jgi:peptide deformylase
VGVRQRVIVVDVREESLVLINPEITTTGGQRVGLESCLSLPDLVGEVCRPEWVVVKGLDRRGRPITVEGEGLLARVLQHEVDHLNGILFVARVEDPTLIWKVSELKAMAEKEVVHI